MKIFLGLLMLISFLTTGARAQGELEALQGAQGNQASTELVPYFPTGTGETAAATIDYSSSSISCLPDSVNEAGIYKVSRAVPLVDLDAFSTFELYLHMNYDNNNDQLLLTYISAYQGKLIPLKQDQHAEGNKTALQWKQAPAVVRAYHEEIGSASRIAFRQAEQVQILGLAESEFHCDQGNGLISWDTGENTYYNGSKGEIRIVDVGEKKLAVYGEISMYYLSGMLYEYVESVINQYINNRGAATQRFVMIPLQGGRLKELRKVEGAR
ncbi:MAG: hypothetical protein ACR2PT_11920 [Endozoicomonas sp.]